MRLTPVGEKGVRENVQPDLAGAGKKVSADLTGLQMNRPLSAIGGCGVFSADLDCRRHSNVTLLDGTEEVLGSGTPMVPVSTMDSMCGGPLPVAPQVPVSW